jgi:hypothetical protein
MYKLYWKEDSDGVLIVHPLKGDCLNEWLRVMREQHILAVKLDSHKDKNHIYF